MDAAYHDRLGHTPKHLPEEEDSRDLDVTGNIHKHSSKRCDKSSRVRIIPKGQGPCLLQVLDGDAYVPDVWGLDGPSQDFIGFVEIPDLDLKD